MISLNNGVAIDITHDNIANGLSSIGHLDGITSTSLQNPITLAHNGVDPNKIIVTINGFGSAFTLDANGDTDTVTINQTIPAGAVIVISYCLESETPTPTPTPSPTPV